MCFSFFTHTIYYCLFSLILSSNIIGTPLLSISVDNNTVNLSWDDMEIFELYCSDNLSDWYNQDVVISPYSMSIIDSNKFFRLNQSTNKNLIDGVEWVNIESSLASKGPGNTDFYHHWAWNKFPQINLKKATITNASDSVFLIRRSDPIAEIKAKYYAGEWNGNIATTNEKWKNLVGNLPQPISTSMGSQWSSGVYWRISGDITINEVDYSYGDLLVYQSLLAHTSTIITDPSVQLGWQVLPAGSLAWRGTFDPINEITPMPLTHNGEVLEIISEVNGFQEGDLWVHGQNIISSNRISVLNPGESVVISNSASEYEYRLKDGTISETKILNTLYDFGLDLDFYQIDDVKKVFSERLGQIDDVSIANSYQHWDISFSDDGKQLYFTSDRGNSSNQFIVNLINQLQPLENNRDIALWGDSIANHYANQVKVNIENWDISENREIRKFFNHGKGSYNARQITDAMDYFNDTNPDLLSRITLIVFDWGSSFDQDLRELMQQLGMLTGKKRYILSGHYSRQRELEYTGSELIAKPRSQSEINFVHKLKNTFGSALDGSGTYADYFEMLTDTPEAMIELNKYDPQFPSAENQLEVIREFNCLPFFSAKSTISNLPTLDPELFRGKFKGYLLGDDSEPTIGENFDYYLSTDETDWFGIKGRVGNIIWYQNGTWKIMSLNDLHPGPVATATIGKIYKRIFIEKNWR